MYHFVIADDHPLFRSALKAATEELPITCSIVEAESFAQTTLRLQQTEADILLLDLKMPGSEGLMGLMQIRNDYPHLAIVVVSASEDAMTIANIKQIGALGFIPKSSSMEQITQAIECVMNGKISFPNVMLNEKNQHMEKLKLLTPKQLNVLKLIAQGSLNKQIAYELAIKETTVKSHISDIFKKLNINNRTQAALIIQELCLVD